MFGYIRPFKPEMKFKDFDAFQAVYCGLCSSLGGTYHILARSVLSYDATFLAILRLATQQNSDFQVCSGGCKSGGNGLFVKKRCPYKSFLKKKTVCVSPQVAFAADINVILFYYKVKDSVKDSAGFFKKLAACLLLPYASLLHKKAARRQPEVEKLAQEYIYGQTEVEEKRSKSVDEAAHPTGRMLAALASYGVEDEKTARVLEALGYQLGRWVYLMDAAEDLFEDQKRRNYNPFNMLEENHEKINDYIEHTLNPCIYQISAAFELLSIHSFEPVVRNILYFGLPQMQRKVLSSIAEEIKSV